MVSSGEGMHKLEWLENLILMCVRVLEAKTIVDI